ncbi:MAG: BamA/TamA family outer membrane protein [Candidatus Krumholzibacteria bacterium]|nr:BamA/TamA family outer membrane protein [Candidatus Krumholzibacteria bacterium]
MVSANRTIYYFITAALLIVLPMSAAADEALSFDPNLSQETEAVASTPQDQPADKTITKVSIIGGHNVKRSIVLSRLGIEPGDPFDPDIAEEGLERVIALSGVKSAFIRILPDRQGGGIKLVIIISDGDTRIVRPALSRALTNDWSFGVYFEDTNLRGMNEDLRVKLLLGGALIAQASFLKPWFVEQLYVGAGLSVSYTDYDYPYPDYGRLLVDKRIRRFEAGAEIRINLTDYLHLSLRPGADVIDVADSMTYDETVPPTPSGTFTTFEAALSVDFLDSDFYPTHGFMIAGGRKDWGIIQEKSEIKNFRYWAWGSGYYKLWKVIGVLHSRAEFTKGGNVPLLLLSHIGGEGTLRGYDFGMLSGTNSILVNSELRLPLNFTTLDDPNNPTVLADFHVFLDSGACWNSPQTFDQGLFHSGFGCGANFILVKKGMLTVDYAWRMQTNGVWSLNAGFFF